MRFLTHALAASVGAALAVGGVAVAAPRHQENVAAQIRQLQLNDMRLKRAAGNLCVWFKHAPRAIELPSGDATLAGWLYNVGLSCDSFGLH
jgi:hypothetical protein